MRICINGFGEYADTLHIVIPSHAADWKELTNILSIVGVVYYYVQGPTIGVRYNESIDPIDAAAQALIVTAAFCNVPLEEVEVEVQERVSPDVNKQEVTRKLRERMRLMTLPPAIPLSQIEARGTAPAYYLL